MIRLVSGICDLCVDPGRFLGCALRWIWTLRFPVPQNPLRRKRVGDQGSAN